jgi:hypothetical protein
VIFKWSILLCAILRSKYSTGMGAVGLTLHR